MTPEELQTLLLNIVREQGGRMDGDLFRRLVEIRGEAARRGAPSLHLEMREVDARSNALIDHVLAALEPELKNYPDPDEFVRIAGQHAQPALLQKVQSWAFSTASGSPAVNPGTAQRLLQTQLVQVSANVSAAFGTRLLRMLGSEKNRREALRREQPPSPASQESVDRVHSVASEGRDEARQARKESQHVANWVDLQWVVTWRTWPRWGRWLTGGLFWVGVGTAATYAVWYFFQRGRG